MSTKFTIKCLKIGFQKFLYRNFLFKNDSFPKVKYVEIWGCPTIGSLTIFK